MNAGELIAELRKYPATMPVRTFGEVVELETCEYFGETVLYLIGEDDE